METTQTVQKPGNAPVKIGEESGYPIFFVNISYNCPKLKMYGFSTERVCRSRIRAWVKKTSAYSQTNVS